MPPYRPTYGAMPFINAYHRQLSECPVDESGCINIGIPGWLRREDALKLYELAYFAAGDVLEFGSHCGLSASIIGRAVVDSRRRRKVTTVDCRLRSVLLTWRTLQRCGLVRYVKVRWADAVRIAARHRRSSRRVAFVFVDHSHRYRDVLSLCSELPELVVEGGFALFHDFNDNRNNDPADKHYGVAQAVIETLGPDRFEFFGIFGCCALYRRKTRR